MAMKFQAPVRHERPEMAAATGGSDIEQQVATAHKYPRDVTKALDKAKRLACMDEETAEEMHYSIPRGGKQIEGPSVRLAEVVAATWGNLRIASRVVEVGEREVTVEGAAIDLENNVAVLKETRRRITGKDGSRFNDDMIAVTTAAASSIAIRNALFSVVPKPFWNQVYAEAAKTINAGKKPIGQRVEAAVKWFNSRGIAEEQVLALLGKKNRGEIGVDEIRELLGIRNAVSEGSSTLQEVFGLPEAAPGVKRSLNLKKPASEPAEAAGAGRGPTPAVGTPPPSEPDPFVSSQPGEGINQIHDSPPPASTPTGPEGGIVLPGEEIPAPVQRSARDEVRHIALELGQGKVHLARAACRRISGGKWDSPNHPACTDEECERVLEAFRLEWMEMKGKEREFVREPGSDG